MAFQIKLLNGSDKAIVINNGTLVISDYSAYEDGLNKPYDREDFNEYYVYILTDELGNEVEYSSDLTLPADVSVIPLPNTISYDTDKVYTIKLIAVPTWNKDVDYIINSCVRANYNGEIVFFKALRYNNNSIPSDRNDWELIDRDSLTSKYYTEETIAVDGIAQEELSSLIKTVSLAHARGSVYNPVDDPEWIKTTELWLALRGLEEYNKEESWSICDSIITHAKTIING